MAQDLWLVPVMALIPILATRAAPEATLPAWQHGLVVVGVLVGIFLVGRYLLPAALGYCAKRHRMDAFGIVLFLALIVAAWAAEQAEISMTLATFVMGMLLSASDYRYQVEATIAPFKDALMGLFFLAVGMSIDVGAFLREWSSLLVHVPVIIGVISGIGAGTRWYRTLFLEEIGKDYVRTARAKGVAETAVLFRHVLKNAMIPILTGVVVVLPLLFMGSLITESFFDIPGLGSYTIDAINSQDFAIVRTMVFLGSVLYIIGLVLTDISYTLVDPRIRLS